MKGGLYIAVAAVLGALLANLLLADPGYVALRFAGRLIEMSAVTFLLLLIVGYFVVSLVLPGILVLLAQVRDWFTDLQPWIDWNYTQVALFEGGTDTAREWAMLGSTTAIWIVLPLVFGLLFLRRSEVK